MISLRHIYYDLKPFLPLGLRMAFRRKLASGIRRNSEAIWPIKPDTQRKPKGWAGWPGNKRFALVLTHDVEGTGGVGRCVPLKEMEEEMGFHSSFNFIPEGTYETPREIRAELERSGFEIGVHDLHHNGKLYRSESDFALAASKINNYLREWNAVGFRSGFMHHNLAWLHALRIQYDLSTFDTDPFEPQPDGVDTIFPFWVTNSDQYGLARPEAGSRSSDSGYVELPYTLPQDSTLFLVLRERSIDIWKSKLDWIASQGGMALLNVHPDYMRFESKSLTSAHYPAAFYREFLEYVQERYAGECWCALPRDVASFFRSFKAGCNGVKSLHPIPNPTRI